MAVPGARIPAERWTVTAAWRAVPGRYPRKPAGSSWPSVTPPTMTSAMRGGRSCGVSNDAAETDTDDGDEADGHSAEEDRLEHAGMAKGHLEVLAGEDPLADLEGDEIGDQRHREGECRQ